MRILFMADLPKDPNSGAAGTEVHFVDALRRQGHEVDEIWNDQLPRRIGHHNLHYLLELPRTYRAALRRAASRAPYDVFHVNQPHGWLAARSIRGRRRGVFVHRSHGFEPHVRDVTRRWREQLVQSDRRAAPRRAASAAMETLLIDRHARLIAKYADGHIVSASGDRDYLVDRLGVDAARVAVIPQAPPDDYRTAPLEPMTDERLRHVLYVGQLAFVKAPMIVAAVMNRLHQLDPALRFTWVCSKDHHDAVRRLTGDYVRLLDWMPAGALRTVYDTHGVFLFLSFFEGFGKVFLEAMSRGLCVIATRTGGMRDVIDDGRDGILVDPGNVDAAVAAIHRVSIEMSAAAAAKARAYSWDRVARESVAFYASLMARQS